MLGRYLDVDLRRDLCLFGCIKRVVREFLEDNQRPVLLAWPVWATSSLRLQNSRSLLVWNVVRASAAVLMGADCFMDATGPGVP